MKTNETNNEIWKDIEGFGGRYQVSSRGRVRSMNYKKTGAICVLNGSVNPNTGYVQISLYDTSTKKGISYYVHRLVAQAFLPNPENLEQVDHIDSNRQNNFLGNLRWIDRKTNNSRLHAVRLRKMKSSKVGHFSQYVKATNIESGEVKYFKNATKAAQNIGCSHVMSIKVLRGEFKQTMGWKLEWVDRNAPECQQIAFPTQTYMNKVKASRAFAERKENVKLLLKKMAAEIRNARLNSKLLSAMKSELRKVVQYTMDGSFVQEFDNAYQAQQLTGLWNIRLALAGMIPDAGGYIWKYKIEV